MSEIEKGWRLKGTYNEACAAEGACPYYFGRAVEAGCRYFMVFRITEGSVNNVDLSGIALIYIGDIPHPSFEELLSLGSEGAVYISNNATEKQRCILDVIAAQSIGGFLMKKIIGIKYVPIDINESDGTVYFKMPSGEMKQYLTMGGDGSTPVRLENQVLPMLTNARACHSLFWRYEDHGRHFDYKNRCGIWADFMFEG